MSEYVKDGNHKYTNLLNQRFGKLLVIGRTKIKSNSNRKHHKTKSMWICQCDCGNITLKTKYQLTHLLQHDCGCVARRKTTERNTTHNLAHSRLYSIWNGMCSRCYNPNRDSWYDYGGKGIYICNEWYTPGVEGNPGFVNFYNWAMENGYHDPEPGEPRSSHLTIDRKDNDGPYAPWNCRWVPKYQQSNNRRQSRYINDGEEILTWHSFELKYGLVEGYVKVRLNYGWSYSAIVYAAKHQDRNIHKEHGTISKSKFGNDVKIIYRDNDGFIPLIPKIPQPEEEKPD